MATPLPKLAPADPLFLERERHQLLREDVIRQGRRHDRLDVSRGPQVDEPRRANEGFVASREKEAVADRIPVGVTVRLHPSQREEARARSRALSIWITRSRFPTSIPNSRTLVATITQFSRAANACSACCLCSWLSELCVTKAVTSN